MNKELVIIGGGSAGLAAAIAAYDQGIRDILILEKSNDLGGILNQCIHNGFGLQEFREQLTGPEYACRFIEQCHERHIDYRLQATVLSLSPDLVVTYSHARDGLVEIQAQAVIYAVGCYERSAGAIRLPGDRPNGIFSAGTAQRYLNIDGYLVGKRVVILGSGDIGLIMARRMHLEGAKVLAVVELMPYSNGLTRNLVQCLEDYDIPLYLSHTVKKTIGSPQLEKVIIAKVDEQGHFIEGSEQTLVCDTLLLSVGLIPETSLLKKANVALDSRSKGPIVNESLETSIPGLFACGNVLHVHDLVDFVTQEAKIAGRAAAQYLKHQRLSRPSLAIEPGQGVRYVVPQKVEHQLEGANLLIKFRVDKPYNKARIVIKHGQEEWVSLTKEGLLPSEMERIALSGKRLKDAQHSLIVEVIADE